MKRLVKILLILNLILPFKCTIDGGWSISMSNAHCQLYGWLMHIFGAFINEIIFHKLNEFSGRMISIEARLTICHRHSEEDDRFIFSWLRKMETKLMAE